MKKTLNIQLVIAALTLLPGCGEQNDIIVLPRIQSSFQPITNGQPTSEYPYVGMLRIGSSGLCTATLVGKKTVLTAGHCIMTQSASAYKFIVDGKTYLGAAVHRHPNFNSSTLVNDIALVILGDAPNVTPSPVASSPIAKGMEVTLVGYGVSQVNQSDTGTKRVAKNVITTVSNTRFSFEGSGGTKGSTCKGDSGGPAFAALNGKFVQVGVTSAGQIPCGIVGYDTRVDAFVSWISETSQGDVVKDSGQATEDPAQPSLDKEAPQVSIKSPANGATVNPEVTIQAVISDNLKVVRADLIVDSRFNTTLEQSPFDFKVTLEPGEHSIGVVGYDEAGNEGDAQITLNVLGQVQDPNSSNSTTEPVEPNPEVTTPKSPDYTPAPGEFGATCNSRADCNSQLCALQSAQSIQYCSQDCDPNLNNCPQGALCIFIGEGKHICGPPVFEEQQQMAMTLTGGCSMGKGAGGFSYLVFYLLVCGMFFFLWFSRR